MGLDGSSLVGEQYSFYLEWILLRFTGISLDSHKSDCLDLTEFH